MNAIERNKKAIIEAGGIITSENAIKLGIHIRTLAHLVKTGELDKLSRGIYRLSELPPLDNIDFIIIALRAPKAVISLESALSYYNLTTEISHLISIALVKNSDTPRIGYPPIITHFFEKKVLKQV